MTRIGAASTVSATVAASSVCRIICCCGGKQGLTHAPTEVRRRWRRAGVNVLATVGVARDERLNALDPGAAARAPAGARARARIPALADSAVPLALRVP